MEITKEQIDSCFIGSTHQADVLIKIYKLVYPDWDNIAKIHGWPKCGKDLAMYISKKFMEFDRKNHPRVMPSRLWMNNGWSILDNEYLRPWEVDPECGIVEYTKEEM